MKTNNFFLFGHKIISLAEFCKNTPTLNDEFKNRLKDENRKTDEIEVGEKRPIVESPSRNEIQRIEEVRKKKIKE